MSFLALPIMFLAYYLSKNYCLNKLYFDRKKKVIIFLVLFLLADIISVIIEILSDDFFITNQFMYVLCMYFARVTYKTNYLYKLELERRKNLTVKKYRKIFNVVSITWILTPIVLISIYSIITRSNGFYIKYENLVTALIVFLIYVLGFFAFIWLWIKRTKPFFDKLTSEFDKKYDSNN